MALSDAIETTADYYASGPYRSFLVDVRRAKPQGVSLVKMAQPAGRYPEPAFNQFGINLVTRAATSARFDFGAGRFPLRFRRGTIALAPPGADCDYHVDGAHEVLCVCLDADMVRQELHAVGTSMPDFGALHARAFTSPLIEHLAFALWQSTSHADRASMMMTQAATLATVAELLRLSRPASRGTRVIEGGLSPRQLREVLAYIHGHLADDISLSDLAAVAGLSTFHFLRAFKQSTGLPPHRYLIDLRIEKAVGMVADGQVPLSTVAAAVGYKDPRYLAKAIAGRTGRSVAAIRAAARKTAFDPGP